MPITPEHDSNATIQQPDPLDRIGDYVSNVITRRASGELSEYERLRGSPTTPLMTPSGAHQLGRSATVGRPMSTTNPDAPLPLDWPVPAGARLFGPRDTDGSRMFVGVDRPVAAVNADEIGVHSSGWQLADGSIEETGVFVRDLFLEADEARGLASALLEAAAEADRWAGK